jgi:hypothetical protein
VFATTRAEQRRRGTKPQKQFTPTTPFPGRRFSMWFIASDTQDEKEWIARLLKRFNRDAYVDDLRFFGATQLVDEDLETYWLRFLCDTYADAQINANNDQLPYVIGITRNDLIAAYEEAFTE